MSGLVRTSNEWVVDVRKHKGQTAQKRIHEPLESLGSIAETKRHAVELKETKRCGDSCFCSVFFMHRDQMIGANQVNFRKHRVAFQGTGEIMYVWDRIPIRDGTVVESSIVPTWAPVTVRFRHHVKSSRPVAAGWGDDAEVQHVLKFVAGRCKAIRR